MLNFEYANPTKIIFGKDQLSKLKQEILNVQDQPKVLIAYGQGSVQRIGLLDKVKQALGDIEFIEFAGIEANPEYSTLIKAVEVIRKEQINFVLALGGGSVIDGVKFIVGAVNFDGDAWDVLEQKPGAKFTSALPFGTILTIPATASEANSGAVISRSEWKVKRTMGGPMFFPKFSFLDPSVVATLPERQIANGIADSFMHTLEQYLTYPSDNYLQEREAEAILHTLIEIAPGVLKDPSNYTLASNLMWCSTHALNGNLRCGVTTDWATHMIGHELTALYGIDHARTLAIICPRLYANKFEGKREKLEQYGRRIWNLEGDYIAEKAIDKTEAFFQSLGIKTKISEYGVDASDAPSIIRKRFEERGWAGIGEKQDLTPEDAELIVQNSI